ncbi:MAG: hypothetical protein WAW61_04310, partial [Methylococcaceae bacterium]
MNNVTTASQKQPLNPAQELLNNRVLEVKSLKQQMEANRAESGVIDERKAEFEGEIATLKSEKAKLKGVISNLGDWLSNPKVSAGQMGAKQQRIYDIDRLIADFEALITALDTKEREENYPILRGLQNDLRDFTRLTMHARAEVLAAKIGAQHRQELTELAALMPTFELRQSGLGNYEIAALTLGQLLFNAVFGGTLREPKFLSHEQSSA